MPRRAGFTHKPETLKKIGDAVAAARALEREGGMVVDRRKCAMCNTYKDSKEFGWRKRKLRDGTFSYTLYSYCKKCHNEKSKARMRGLSKEERSERYRRWHLNQKAKKQEAADKHSPKSDPKLPIQPLIDKLNEIEANTAEIAKVSGMHEATVRRWRRGKNNNNDKTDFIPLTFADQITFGADLQLWEVWPEMASESAAAA